MPEEYFALYPEDDMPDAKLDPGTGYERHPWADAIGVRQPHNNCLTPELTRRAYGAYLGLCSFVDAEIGRVLTALDAAGLTDTTRPWELR